MITFRPIIKKTLGRLFRSLPTVKHKVKRGLTVFVFHEVSDCPSPFASQYDLAVSTVTFRRQATWIKQNFNLIHPRELLEGKAIPDRAAIISFDDGFLGAFQCGLVILEELGLPSIIFLNMQSVITQEPLLSAIACYLGKYAPAFSTFAQAANLRPPFHLTLSPAIMQDFENRYGPIDHKAVLAYQGPFASIATLKLWDGKELVCYGNHLFQHWNACALSPTEFELQYTENERALAPFVSSVNLFAFTNGQPGTCWTERDVTLLARLGARKVFSARGGVNPNSGSYVLGRLSLTDRDVEDDDLWFRVGRGALSDPHKPRLVSDELPASS